MDRIWLKSYPPGLPADVELGKLSTLAQLVEESCASHADSVAYVQMGRSMTYRELEALSRSFAAYLQKDAGMLKGERFAIMLPKRVAVSDCDVRRPAVRALRWSTRIRCTPRPNWSTNSSTRVRPRFWCSRTSHTCWRKSCHEPRSSTCS